MKKNQNLMLGLFGLVLIVAGWWFLLYSPRTKELADAKSAYESAKSEESKLNATLARRKDLVKTEPKLDLRLAQLPDGDSRGQHDVHRHRDGIGRLHR